jgi:uncharacterized protein YjbI with pentapeptide repeats
MNKPVFSKKRIKPPKMPKQALIKGQLDVPLLDHTYHTQIALSYDDLTAQDAVRVSFDQVTFQQVQMSKTRFKHVQLLDSQLLVCAEASLCRVELIGCHLTGWQCGEARFQDILFKECSGSLAQFAFSKFHAVRFEACNLSDANFLEADLTDAVFLNCDLRNADFTGAKLAGADLRGSTIDGVRVGPRELRGATIDPNQALAFVKGMGIHVESL